ncbi:MAG: metal ABC transporter permease [Myxococcales bacterium]|nr:metal ABC transporter permease [Myxococcales bacterium]
MYDHPHAPSFDEFLAGWEMDLYRDPVYCGVFAGIVLGYLGVFVVLRRTVFLTAAVSQAAGLGVALAFFAQIHLAIEVPPMLGAALLALALSALLALPLQRMLISREALLAICYLLAWAAAVLVGSRIRQESHDISSILFGSAVLVSRSDLWTLLILGGVSLSAFLLLHRGMAFAIFDREAALVQQLPVRAIEFGAGVLTALCVAVATRALGVLPVFAFSVLPGVAALMLLERLRAVLLLAAAIGALSGGAGYLLAFFQDLPVGASQASVAAAFFVLAWMLRRLGR